MIEVENLTKKFGDFVAVDNISFSVKRGEIFAFLGPSAAAAYNFLTDFFPPLNSLRLLK